MKENQSSGTAMFETARLLVRKFRDEDARPLYENHLDDAVRKWFPNECYADLAEAQAALLKAHGAEQVQDLHGATTIQGTAEQAATDPRAEMARQASRWHYTRPQPREENKWQL